MNNVISFKRMTKLKKIQTENNSYHTKVLDMKKIELLEEVILFQKKRSHKGALSLEMMIQGKTLFSILEKNAEIKELKKFAHTYQKHLEYEIKEFLHKTKANYLPTQKA